jgi:hypothetical protein
LLVDVESVGKEIAVLNGVLPAHIPDKDGQRHLHAQRGIKVGPLVEDGTLPADRLPDPGYCTPPAFPEMKSCSRHPRALFTASSGIGDFCST